MSLVGLSTPEEPFVDREELARRLNVSVWRVDQWRKDPTFPQETWGARCHRFQEGRVLAWLRNPNRRNAA